LKRIISGGTRTKKVEYHWYRRSVGLLGRRIGPSQGLYLHRTTRTQKQLRHISMPREELEPAILVFEHIVLLGRYMKADEWLNM
jgi:hypothetical protein